MKRIWTIFMGLCGLAALAVCAASAGAQMQEMKPKPAMYTYVADWQVARAHWADMDKLSAPVNDALQKAVDDGTLVAYGNDVALVHGPGVATNSIWWSSMSMGGLIKGLEKARGASDANSPVLNDAKHWDSVFVSHFYNWKSGSFKGGYLHVSMYKLKDDAPDDALDNLAEHLVVPVMEKLVADGTITAYAIFTQAIHTDAPGTFAIDYITATPDGLDTVQAAIRESGKAHPLGIQAFGSVIDDSAHRDFLDRVDATFK
jgi:hypothetical protein